MEENKHFSHAWHLIKMDLQRFGHHANAMGLLRVFSPYAFSFKMTFWYRIGHYLLKCNHPLLHKCLMPLVRFIHQHNSYRTGIQMSFRATVGGAIV